MPHKDPEARREYMRQYRAANQERIKEQMRSWQVANKERVQEVTAHYREEHREELRAADRARYEANREKRREQGHAWYEANREREIARVKAWQQANPERKRANAKASYQRHIEKRRAAHRDYYRANRERFSEWASDRNREDRLAALAHYSGGEPVCACCGERHIEFLTIDHINGGGAAHRRAGARGIGRWLRLNGYPEGFRVLCANCNHARGAYGYCPHEREKAERPALRDEIDVPEPDELLFV